MGERSSYAHGTFCWTDLSTTDPDGAKAFYTGFFGWEPDDMPAGDQGIYTMLRLEGRDAAALSALVEEQRAPVSPWGPCGPPKAGPRSPFGPSGPGSPLRPAAPSCPGRREPVRRSRGTDFFLMSRPVRDPFLTFLPVIVRAA